MACFTFLTTRLPLFCVVAVATLNAPKAEENDIFLIFARLNK